jgi:PPOX class probable F420-dependent enzyme
VSTVLPDESTPFGQQVASRLREDLIGWLTTVGLDGTPQPNPVWFLWDGEKLLVYNQPGARRLVNIQRNPMVSFHLNSAADGNGIIILTGEAEVSASEKPAHEVPAYVAKYQLEAVDLEAGSMEGMAKEYSIALHIRPTKVRGF